MNYWILQVNPNSFRYRVGQPLHHYPVGGKDWWGVSRYINEIRHNDVVFIWQSIDYRDPNGPKPRGIYARGEVIAEPDHPDAKEEIDELKEKQAGCWINPQEKQKQEAKPSILIRYNSACVKNPLTAEELKACGLGNIPPLRFVRAEIYRLPPQDAIDIEKLFESRKDS